MKKVIVVMVTVIALMLTGCGNTETEVATNTIPETLPLEMQGTYNARFATDGEAEISLEVLGYEGSAIIIKGDCIGIKLGDTEAITPYKILAKYDDYYAITLTETDDLVATVYYDGTACLGDDETAIVFRKES